MENLQLKGQITHYQKVNQDLKHTLQKAVGKRGVMTTSTMVAKTDSSGNLVSKASARPQTNIANRRNSEMKSRSKTPTTKCSPTKSKLKDIPVTLSDNWQQIIQKNKTLRSKKMSLNQHKECN